ncbi:RNA polymerase II transcription factor B subunit 1 [Rhizophlyctis rosea]|uniref:RNA polymerase II transcription factor B subunit 1 n=1 Tax=Rhizophlyctis rosea TaxID=64517 RepID=A0AAD5X6M6_9FUNG|nr:RNA polymerase II transcription factor B subunit 1 [Rhizophlyctis rosea]
MSQGPFSVYYNKVEGLLHIKPAEFQWRPKVQNSAPTVVIPFARLKGQQRNKNPAKPQLKVKATINSAEADWLFHFASEADRTIIEGVIRPYVGGSGPSTPVGTPTGAGASAQPHARASPRPQPSGAAAAEVTLRRATLKKHPELEKKFEMLVVGKLITEEDFWNQRKHLLEAQRLETQQQKGLASASFASPKLGEDVKINAAWIRSTLAQHPAVRKAYEEKVERLRELSRNDFWGLYTKSGYFFRSLGENGTKGNDLIDKYVNEEDDDFQIHPKRARIDTRDRLVDLDTTAEDHLETGNKPDITMEAGKVKPSLALLRRFNRHSEMVVKAGSQHAATPITADRADLSYLKQTEIPDLQKPGNSEVLPLSISDPTRYFQAQANVSTATLIPTEEDAASFRDHIQIWNPKLAEMSMDKPSSARILKSLNEASKKRKRDKRLNQEYRLPDGKEPVLQLHALVTELQRRFWVAATDASGQRKAECHKILKELEKHVEKVRADNSQRILPVRERCFTRATDSMKIRVTGWMLMRVRRKPDNATGTQGKGGSYQIWPDLENFEDGYG